MFELYADALWYECPSCRRETGISLDNALRGDGLRGYAACDQCQARAAFDPAALNLATTAGALGGRAALLAMACALGLVRE